MNAPPRLSVTRFLAFGDSITWGEDGRVSGSALAALTLRPRVQFPIADTYPGALNGLLSGRYTAQSPQMTNGGLKGEAVTDPTTFPRYVSYTSSRAYDVVLLMEGANDLADHGFSEIIAGLDQMIRDAQSRQMQVLLATIPPENPDQLEPGGVSRRRSTIASGAWRLRRAFRWSTCIRPSTASCHCWAATVFIQRPPATT